MGARFGSGIGWAALEGGIVVVLYITSHNWRLLEQLLKVVPQILRADTARNVAKALVLVMESKVA